MAKIGRPTGEDLRARRIEEVFERHANGEPLVDICRELDLKAATFRTWMRQDATLATQWDAVKREYVHSLFDKLSSVTAQLARAEFSKEDGAAVQALKAAQDGYKHMTSRLNPSAYGDTKDKNTGVTVIINTSLPVGVGDKPLEVVDGDFKVVVPLLENANG